MAKKCKKRRGGGKPRVHGTTLIAGLSEYAKQGMGLEAGKYFCGKSTLTRVLG